MLWLNVDIHYYELVMNKKDPSSTLTLRSRVVSKLNRRFDNLKKLIRVRLVKENFLQSKRSVLSNAFEYEFVDKRLKEFATWLDSKIAMEILRAEDFTTTRSLPYGRTVRETGGPAILAAINYAYDKSVENTRRTLAKKLAVESTESGIFGVLGPDGALYANPIRAGRAKVLYARAFEQLKGITKTMAQQIADVLSRGIIEGKGISSIVRDITDRVDKIGKVRARLLARTEIVRAHNVAAIDEAQYVSDTLGETVKMIWLTALDGRERPSHKARHNKIYTRKKALSLIGEPNCRCSISAYIK